MVNYDIIMLSLQFAIYPLTFAKILLIINLVKKLFVSISSLFSYLFLVLPAFAQTTIPTPAAPVSINLCSDVKGIAQILCSLGGDNIAHTIQRVVVFFIILAVVIALIYLLYGGVKWITSGGEKTKVEEARNHIMAALIGLIVVVLAVFLLSVILAAFGIRWAELEIPVISTANPINKK